MSGEFGKTVLHGVDQSVPEYDDLPNKGNQASECMGEDLLSKHIYDLNLAKWLPMEYIPFLGYSKRAACLKVSL